MAAASAQVPKKPKPYVEWYEFDKSKIAVLVSEKKTHDIMMSYAGEPLHLKLPKVLVRRGLQRADGRMIAKRKMEKEVRQGIRNSMPDMSAQMSTIGQIGPDLKNLNWFMEIYTDSPEGAAAKAVLMGLEDVVCESLARDAEKIWPGKKRTQEMIRDTCWSLLLPANQYGPERLKLKCNKCVMQDDDGKKYVGCSAKFKVGSKPISFKELEGVDIEIAPILSFGTKRACALSMIDKNWGLGAYVDAGYVVLGSRLTKLPDATPEAFDSDDTATVEKWLKDHGHAVPQKIDYSRHDMDGGKAEAGEEEEEHADKRQRLSA